MKGVGKSIALALILYAIALTAAADALGVEGYWSATWSEKENVYSAALILKISGHQITGTFTDQNRVDWRIENGKLEGNRLSFDASETTNGETRSRHMVGIFMSDVITLHNDPGSQGEDQEAIMIFHRTEETTQGRSPCARPLATGTAHYSPLTSGQKFGCTVGVLAHPTFLVGIGIGSGIAQLQHAPSQWELGAEGYGRRFGTLYGIAAFRQSVLFAGTRLLHEDPRPLRSERHGFLPRTADALKLGLLSRRDDGSLGFAWARSVADLGTGTLGMAVYPGHPITGRSMMTLSLGYFAGREASSVFGEFAPDVAKALRLDRIMRMLHLQKR
jgi:hypothetical protein